ncbi:hypothetical protein MXB_4741, partial [Myxobolus squamalis]
MTLSGEDLFECSIFPKCTLSKILVLFQNLYCSTTKKIHVYFPEGQISKNGGVNDFMYFCTFYISIDEMNISLDSCCI